jgi:signal transduction histidine kinase
MQTTEHALEFDSRLIDDMAEHADSLAQASTLEVEKNQWIDEQLTRTVVANMRRGLLVPLLTTPITVAVLYGKVALAVLLVWALAVMYLTCHRFWVVRKYTALRNSARPEQAQLFFEKNSWSWVVSAVVWSALMFGYYGKVPVEDQFVCVMMIVGIGVVSVVLISGRLDLFRSYITGLVSVAMASVLLAWVTHPKFPSNTYDAAFAVLLVIFWLLMRTAGGRFNLVLRRGYALQFDNEHLIASLREKTSAAMEAVQVKNRLLAHAAHDLRQPVHALAFYADWLRNEPQMSPEVVPKILQATDSVNTLFNSLFDFAKIESGGIVPDMQKVNIREVIDELALQFGPAALAKNLEFRKRITDVVVWTDPILIRRVVGNLLSNAIRYTEKGGVLLCVRVHGERARIEVWDTGVGIAPQHQAHVFREFYKVPQHQGTEDSFGLGLAIVDRLTKSLNHHVSVKSIVGRGTRFRVQM